MRNIAKCFAVMGLACFALTSCDNDKFLDVPHYDILDIESQFESDDNARRGLNGIYAYNHGSTQDNNWGFKPNLFTGSHPTMDTQCTGWDVKFLDQTWDENVDELYDGWAHAYAAIARANLYLAGLQEAVQLSDDTKKKCEGEARALRGYFYTWLATTFGRVPMLATGEDFSNTPVKAAAETYEEMWDFIIADFTEAAKLLDWKPVNDQYGRCTKGMAKAYLADALMWKAFRCPETASDCYTKAKQELNDIITSGTYKLTPNFATNWDPAGFWNEECIWAACLDEGKQWSSWGSDRTIDDFNPNMMKWFCACPENGGWGAEYLSWEWYSCYEHGDTRRDASCATGAVPKEQLAQYGIEKSEVVYGYHPYLKDSLGLKKDGHVAKPDVNAEGVLTGTKTMQFHFDNGEKAPSIWTTKLWRTALAEDSRWNHNSAWGGQMWAPTIIYAKRYANVLLDYAECCFRTEGENSAEGWKAINDLRDRAWGKFSKQESYDKYFGHYNEVYNYNGMGITMTEYPVGVVTGSVTVPDAKTYYTALQAKPNRVGYSHTSPAWLVAVNEERRKEFNSEWCLCPDMVRSGYIEDHINYNYPKDDGGSDYANYPWTKRSFDFDIKKMDMPIPAKEILKNPVLKQNPGYEKTDDATK